MQKTTTTNLVTLYQSTLPQLDILIAAQKPRADKQPDAPASTQTIASARRLLRDTARIVSRLPDARHVRLPLADDAANCNADIALTLAQARQTLVAFKTTFQIWSDETRKSEWQVHGKDEVPQPTTVIPAQAGNQ